MSDSPQYTLRLFFSVDFVGSIAFKQGQEAVDVAHPWAEAFRLFYSQVPEAFTRKWQELNRDALGPPPSFWKALGDELLFVKEVTDYRQALWTLSAWREAIRESRTSITAAYPSLDLKSTAWSANFPVANFEVGLPSGGVDFIGPSMDAGFRLAALGSPTRMVVSLGMALLLAEALSDEEARRGFGQWALHYDGPAALKGLLSGTTYPVFSVDMRRDTEKTRAEDRLSGRITPSLADIITVCRATIAERPTHFFAPYIDPVYPGDPKFREIPEAHAKAAASRSG